MSRRRLFVLCVLAALPMLLFRGSGAAEKSVVQLDINGPIGPATSDYIHRGLEQATRMKAVLVVLRMDTPGGLDIAMRRIIRDILASPVPVAAFVAPSGARAASAGTYILYASEIAAMAPATNLGAATPVQIGGLSGPAGAQEPGKSANSKAASAEPPADPMTRKMVNDAVAYIRSLAQLRGRNADWAEQAVRQAVSLPASEALKLGVVDLIARNVDDLLDKINGRAVNVSGQTVILDTAGARVLRVKPDWRNRLLSVITDPNVAYVLMLLGLYGLFFELWHPGFILPGVIGAICLLLALFAFQVLPVSFAGLGLMLLGVAFMVAEAFVPSFGALGVGGVIAFVVGSVMLLDTESPGFGVSWWLIGSVSLVSAAFFMTVVTLALKARRRPVVTGREELIGAVGEALSAFEADGRVRVHSEEWQAHTRLPLARGQKVRVVGIKGLVLSVEPYDREGA
ncbi:MAG: NfeD family protein [Acidiferrobacterales bacterium]